MNDFIVASGFEWYGAESSGRPPLSRWQTFQPRNRRAKV